MVQGAFEKKTASPLYLAFDFLEAKKKNCQKPNQKHPKLFFINVCVNTGFW